MPPTDFAIKSPVVPPAGVAPPASMGGKILVDGQTPTIRTEALTEAVARNEGKNLGLLAAYTVVFRTAWIFKTETVIIPAFLHAVSGQPWMQGWLPLLNRFGQSLPPLFYANTLRDLPRKQASLLRTTLAMGGIFLLFAAALQFAPRPTVWWPTLFLAGYAAYFVATGLNNLAFNTLQGKLLRPQRRGQLMSRGGVIGSAAAVAAVWLVLKNWRADRLDSFQIPFLVAGLGMVASGLFAWLVLEPADPPAPARPRQPLLTPFVEAWRVIRADADFRTLAVCGSLFISSQLLFPHYIPLAAETVPDGSMRLLVFVAVQNVGVGLFSLLLGTLADRRGNRFALRVALLTCAATPLLAVALSQNWLPGGAKWYWLTFAALGMQPVTFKTFTNYTLELTEPRLHPRYLSTLTICLAVPVLASLPVGWLIGRIGYPPVFLATSVAIAAAWLLTFRMVEPRRR